MAVQPDEVLSGRRLLSLSYGGRELNRAVLPANTGKLPRATKPMHKVKLKRSHLDYFRKLARESELEVQAYLIGEVVSPTITVIDSFAYTSRYGVQTREKVVWYRADYEHVKRIAEKRGRRIIGSIHSHPDWDAVVSPSDYRACMAEGHRICGIVSTDGPRTRVRFWVMDCALPCEIMYAKKKATSDRHQSTPAR